MKSHECDIFQYIIAYVQQNPPNVNTFFIVFCSVAPWRSMSMSMMIITITKAIINRSLYIIITSYHFVIVLKTATKK